MGGKSEILIAGEPDAAVVYVGAWLLALVVVASVSPRLQSSGALAVAFGALCIGVASLRFIDLFSYQLGILLDPRQRHLRGPERGLVLLALNLVELALITAIWLYVGGLRTGGHLVGRGDVWLDSVNSVSLLTPAASAPVPLVLAQLVAHVGAVLLLVASVGTLLGLISASFKHSEP